MEEPKKGIFSDLNLNIQDADIIERLRLFDLENSTPVQCRDFLSSLKQNISAWEQHPTETGKMLS